MAADPKAAALALHRFGLGPRSGSINRIAADPRGALLAELQKPKAGGVPGAGLLSGPATARALYAFNTTAAARRSTEPKAMAASIAMPRAMLMEGGRMGSGDMQPAKQDPSAHLPRYLYIAEAKARFDAAVSADIGFVERLVWFWSNHFCVAGDKVGAMAGPYEREAIRPYVLGRFADMLRATGSHPAMLLYLDNALSTGPNSTVGASKSEGLNENLAREIMELHTVGVRSGYSQGDVTNFAKIITGWSFRALSDTKRGGEFEFEADRHEPGPQTVWGKTYPEGGVEQGRAVLADLARKPQTATFLATKLARHFVADEPPQTLVDKLAKSFRDTDGNLGEMAKALVTAPESWSAPRSKLKRPDEWIISAARATGVSPDPNGVVRALVVLGQPLWVPSGPNGFSDASGVWSEGISQRLDIAAEYAEQTADRLDPLTLIDTSLGPLASQDTRETIARAGSRQQALTLLLLAPEFQRR